MKDEIYAMLTTLTEEKLLIAYAFISTLLRAA